MDATPAGYRLLRALFGRLLSEVMIRADLVGAANVSAEGPVLLVSNHRSPLDPLVLGAVLDRPLHFVADSWLDRLPPVRIAMEAAGTLVLPRSPGRSETLVAEGGRILRQGGIVAIFPEGVGNFEDDGAHCQLARLHTAFAMLALSCGVPNLPIVPVAIVPEDEQVLVRLPCRLFRALDPATRAYDCAVIAVRGYRKARIVIGPAIATPSEPPSKEAISRLTGRVQEAIARAMAPACP